MSTGTTVHSRKRLKRTDVFRAISRRGRWARGALITVGTHPNHLHQIRIGLRGARAVRSAVTRNRIKRQLRAILFRDDLPLREGLDLVIVFHPRRLPVKAAELHHELESLCRRAGALR